jgi:PAS domain S-box-containing protein
VGGYRMAWVGFARPDEEKSVQPLAQQGFEDGYVQTLRVSWAEVERGRGPVGTAIRTGKPAISRDTQTDPRFAPWREDAFKRGYASVLALPLVDGQPFGTLAIYATEVNAFDDEEINLLIGLANDLAYGIKALRAGAERRRVEEALRQSEQKYRSLMDGASDAIVLADPRGMITEANQRAEDLLGYSEAELLGMNYPLIHPAEKLDHVLENFEEILTTGSGPLHECVVRRKDGQTVPVEIAHVMVGSGDNQVIQAVFRDVTERKRAGEALRDSEQKLRLLASQLLTVQEKERRRVSRELHDELGQALTVLKIHLVAIENKLRRDQQGLKVSCERLLGYIDAVIENVRRLSWDLSPSILEDLGLSSSLKYLVQEICRNNNMLYSVAVDEIDNLFSPEVKINIYRIFQESLTNIVRYAQAGRINVEIKKQQDRVTFLLRDNGLGFDVKEARSRNLDKRGLGLTTMHERALIAGGTLNISSHKGQGTDVILTIPLQR